MPDKVTFASSKPKELRADATLPMLLDRMVGKWNFKKRFKDKRVAIKMHLGGNVGYSTVHPLLVRRVVSAVKAAGGRPFITDSPGAVSNAHERGYTAEVLGAPLHPVVIVLSHGKGHGQSGFGGAIKNIAMGCVDTPTRGQIHRLMSAAFEWDESKCTGCRLCIDNCPNNAIIMTDGKISFIDHHCKYCMHCEIVCPSGAISIDQSGYRHFQHGMAVTTREVLRTFEPGRVFFITELQQITPYCDCWGFTTPSIVPDIGIVAGDSICAVETAALDLIKAENFIEGSLTYPLKRTGGGHLFQQIHGKDPYIQIEECIKIGLGDGKYRLVKVK